MLVLSRQRDETIHVGRPDGQGWQVTVVNVRGDKTVISISNPDPAVEKIQIALERDQTVDLEPDVRITVVDIRIDKVRLGIFAPREYSVHRLEVYRAIRKELDAGRRLGGEEDGMAGSCVPRPDKPRPPSLDVSLEEPGSDDAA